MGTLQNGVRARYWFAWAVCETVGELKVTMRVQSPSNTQKVRYNYKA